MLKLETKGEPHAGIRPARSGYQKRCGGVTPGGGALSSEAARRDALVRLKAGFEQACKDRHLRLYEVPPLGNNLVAMVKDSSLASVLGVADVTQMGKVYASGSFRFFETYSIVAYIYLILTVGLSPLLRALERRLRQGRAG